MWRAKREIKLCLLSSTARCSLEYLGLLCVIFSPGYSHVTLVWERRWGVVAQGTGSGGEYQFRFGLVVQHAQMALAFCGSVFSEDIVMPALLVCPQEAVTSRIYLCLAHGQHSATATFTATTPLLLLLVDVPLGVRK